MSTPEPCTGDEDCNCSRCSDSRETVIADIKRPYTDEDRRRDMDELMGILPGWEDWLR